MDFEGGDWVCRTHGGLFWKYRTSSILVFCMPVHGGRQSFFADFLSAFRVEVAFRLYRRTSRTVVVNQEIKTIRFRIFGRFNRPEKRDACLLDRLACVVTPVSSRLRYNWYSQERPRCRQRMSIRVPIRRKHMNIGVLSV